MYRYINIIYTCDEFDNLSQSLVMTLALHVIDTIFMLTELVFQNFKYSILWAVHAHAVRACTCHHFSNVSYYYSILSELNSCKECVWTGGPKSYRNCHITDTCETWDYVHALTHMNSPYFVASLQNSRL